MRTFEFKDGKSSKFWNIDLAGTEFTVVYGKIGTAGQTQTKSFPTEDKARAAHDKLVAEKTGKGYVETTAGATAAAAPSSGKALENAILANPDDLGAHAAYADWLIEQGDPRGEFIQVQLALEDESKPAKERKELQKREQELLKKHEREWLGELADSLIDQKGVPEYYRDEGNRFQFARGWLDTLRVRELTVALSRAIAKTAQARMVRRLEILGTAYEEEGEFEEGDDIPDEAEHRSLYPLLKASAWTNVRVFQLGEQFEDSRYGGSSCHTTGEGAVDLIKKMPRLEELYLMAHNIDTDALFSLKTLTRLQVLHVCHLHQYPLEKLARNPVLGQLRQILFHPHGLDDEEAYIQLADVRAVVRSEHLKNLTHLHVRLSDLGDEGCKEIVASGVLKRLKVLELSHGCITDAGAGILAACPDLSKLDLLNVNYNALTKEGIKTLKKVGIDVKAEEQHTQQEIDDRTYLYEGDPE